MGDPHVGCAREIRRFERYARLSASYLHEATDEQGFWFDVFIGLLDAVCPATYPERGRCRLN